MVENPPFNVGDIGSIPDWGTRIPHPTGKLSMNSAMRIKTEKKKKIHWKDSKNGQKKIFFLIEGLMLTPLISF